MKIKNIIFKGVAISAIAGMFIACSDSFLETTPTRYLDQESISQTLLDDPAKVQAFVNGAYMNLYAGGDYYTAHDNAGLPAIKLATDIMCDDIAYQRDLHYFCYDYQLDNRMGNYRRPSGTWNQLYNVIDNANTIISLIKPEDGDEPASDAIKIMLGEAYSLRAYCYFWLVNLWQHAYSTGINNLGIPLKTDEEYRQERVPVGEVYEQILSDIDKGYNYLQNEGYHNDKTGLSEYAAAAIYSNVLMFTGDYANAANYAEKAAAGGTLDGSELMSGFNSVRMKEVLWGYSVNNETSYVYASFFSHVDPYMMGYGGAVGYRKTVASELYNQIVDEDVRKGWFGYNAAYNLRNNSFAYEESEGTAIYLQNKFRDVYITSGGSESAFSSDILYFRSGEMYFVAAEAYFLNNNEPKAREMLNKVMETRISGYNYTGSGDNLYKEICLQKRIETWMEGNRYLDAKRRGETIDRSKSTNHATDLANLSAITYNAGSDYRMIYHIPNSERENNPSITNNEDNP